MDTIISKSPAETFAAAARLAAGLHGGEVLALSGDLGAGKTHFVKGLAVALGMDLSDVTSPTFTLVHEHGSGRLPLYHFDFYRLETADEALGTGLDEYLESGGVCAIEWAEKFPELLPPHTLWIHLRNLADGSREIGITLQVA